MFLQKLRKTCTYLGKVKIVNQIKILKVLNHKLKLRSREDQEFKYNRKNIVSFFIGILLFIL